MTNYINNSAKINDRKGLFGRGSIVCGYQRTMTETLR